MLLIQDVEEINKELESTFDIFEKIESKYRKSPLSAFCNIKKIIYCTAQKVLDLR